MEFACLIFLGLLGLAYPIERIADEISAYDGVESSIKAEDANAWEIALNFTSNSPVLFDEAGHYRLELQLSTLSSNNGTQDFRATTACFSVGEPPMHLASQLEELTLTRMIGENATTVTAPLKHALYVDVRRFGTGRKLYCIYG